MGRLEFIMGGQAFGREIIKEVPGIGVIELWGTVAEVPADGAEGYAPGCRFTNIETTALTDAFYINTGTLASAEFDLADVS
jgi:hypothetical protein